MSEYVPPSRPRPVRIMCLHGLGQSAASFRALLGPLLGKLPKNYEFHFLDAAFVASDASLAASSSSKEEELLREAITMCSHIEALESRNKAKQLAEEMAKPRQQGKGKGKTATSPVERLRPHPKAEQLQQKIQSTSEGTMVYEAFRRAGLDECETLLAKGGYVAPDRDWVVAYETSEGTDDEDYGLQHTLGQLSDYVRTYGPFHGIIASGNGVFGGDTSSWSRTSMIALLLSALLDQKTHPGSALTYPLVYPLLPLDAPAPRMGGWEVMPSMPLPSGRRTATAPGPFSFVVQIGPSRPGDGGTSPSSVDDFLRQQVKQWLGTEGPKDATVGKEYLASLGVVRGSQSSVRPPDALWQGCSQGVSLSEGETLIR